MWFLVKQGCSESRFVVNTQHTLLGSLYRYVKVLSCYDYDSAVVHMKRHQRGYRHTSMSL